MQAGVQMACQAAASAHGRRSAGVHELTRVAHTALALTSWGVESYA
jgi:hypothetical protein